MNKKIGSKFLLALLSGFLLLSVTSCTEKKGTFEKAGENMDEAVDDVRDQMDDAADEAHDEVEEMGDKIEDSTDR